MNLDTTTTTQAPRSNRRFFRRMVWKLEACRTSEAYVAIIGRIAATQDPDAIVVLARLLDMPGPGGKATVDALVGFGAAAVPVVRRRLEKSMDGHEIENAHRVLAALGDEASMAVTGEVRPVKKAPRRPALKDLVRALAKCDTNDERLPVIRAIARTQDPDAIEILVQQLELPGAAGQAAVKGLVRFGIFAETRVRRVVEESMDEDEIRNAHRVLAALGDAYSRRAVRAHCWADLEVREPVGQAKAAAPGKPTDADVG